METTGSLDEGSNFGIPLWIQYLNRMEWLSVWRYLGWIIRDALQATGESQIALAARRIDDYYRDGFRRSGGDTVYFLVHLYYLIFNVAKFLPYDGPLQDILVRLAVELQKLPETWCELNDDEFDIDTLHSAFVAVMDDICGSRRPTSESANSQQLESLCDTWINLSTFNARCIQSGVLDIYDEVCMHPLIEIANGLEEDHPPGVMKRCFTNVAVQYILLAGSKIYHELVEKPVEGSEAAELGLGKWQLWMEKLTEVAQREDAESELGRAAREAHSKMASLHSPRIVNGGEPSLA